MKAKIFALGNRYRRDDGVGPWVAGRLRAAGLQVFEVGDDLTRLMEGWAKTEEVTVIEAVISGAQAGTVYRLEVGQEPLSAIFSGFSSHAFNLAQAVELSRTLGNLPKNLLILAIEGQDFGFGEGLSPEVEQAALGLIEYIRNTFTVEVV